MENNARKPAQIVASLIYGREHQGKWTSFHLLPDLFPLRFVCCHVKLQTSVGSPLPTQLQAASESVGSLLPTQFERVKLMRMCCVKYLQIPSVASLSDFSCEYFLGTLFAPSLPSPSFPPALPPSSSNTRFITCVGTLFFIFYPSSLNQC